MRFTWMKGLAVLAVLLLAAPAFAQTTGRVDGKVVDDKGAALPGVTVTLSSPNLQGDRIAVTEADGQFRFLGLPPGNYSLRAQLEGFAILEQPSIDVGLSRTVSLELKMSPAFGEEVTVSGAAPIIDTTSTTSGANFSEDLFKELPVSRTFTGVAFAAPGVVTGGIEGTPSIGGASVAENRYVVDGLDTTDPAFGTIGTQVPFEFIKEVEVKTGGYEAEYGGALGGLLNIVTKSGGNQFEGDVFGYWSDDSLQSEVPQTAVFGQDLGFTEYDFGAAFGGKIIQDKLWYFVAANPNHEEEKTTNRGGVENIEETDRGFYAGKLTWQLNPNHQVVFSAFGDPTDRKDQPLRNAFGSVANDSEFGANNFGVTYNGTLSSSLFLELSAGRYDETVTQTPNNNSSQPLYQVQRFGGDAEHFAESFGCYTPGAATSAFSINANCDGGSFHQSTGDTSRDEARGAFTWFGNTGAVDHEIKLGATVRSVDYDDVANYPNQIRGRDFVDEHGVVVNAGGIAGQRIRLFNGFYLWQEYNQNSKGTTDETALYLQDRIRFNDYFSLNLGVRADQFESTGEKSNLAGRKLDFKFGDMVAPRVGFTWDVAKNGRSKLYGHYGRFYESVPLDINARAFGNEQFNFYYFYYPSDGSVPTFDNPGEWFYTYRLGTGTRVSDDIEPMYTTEALAGFEYEVAPNVAVGVKYTDRSVDNVIEDISVDGGQTYFITNPGGLVTFNPVTGEPLDTPVLFPTAERNYEAWELSLNKRFTNNWQLYGSYVHSVNEGNYGGLFRQDNGQLDPNITSLFDLPELLNGAFGKLPNDRTHQFKVYGSYLWPIKLVTGFYGQFLSGVPISKLGAHPVYGANERFITPRGSAGRTPDIWNIDLHLEYPITFGSGLELKLIADIFNITDQQEAATVNQQWTTRRARSTTDPNECGGPGTGPGTACPEGDPDWGTPTSFQQPQTFRLGVKLSF